MKTHIQKHITAALLGILLLFGAGVTAIPAAMAQDTPATTQPFENSSGLTNISKPSEGGVDTKKLGIYGPDASGESNLILIISNIVNSVFLLLGFVAVVLLIVEGVLLIVSRGQEERRKKVTATIINIAIGFAVILLSYAIIDQILRVLGDNNIQGREGQIQQIDQLQNQIGITDQVRRLANETALYPCAVLDPATKKVVIDASGKVQVNEACKTSQYAFGNAYIPEDVIVKLDPEKLKYANAARTSQPIAGDYRTVDLEFVAGSARLPALRGSVLRLTQADWAEVKKGTFGLFIPGSTNPQNMKAWVKNVYSYSIPADAVSVSASAGSNASGTSGYVVNLNTLRDRLKEGIATPNYIQVNIPGLTTASLTVVILKADEENKFMFPLGEAFADYRDIDPASASPWSDIASGLAQGYDRRRSFFKIKEKGSSLDARTYTTGASIQLNDGAEQKDIEAEITLDDQNTLPENYQTIEHTLTRGDGVLLRDAAKKGDTFTVTVPLNDDIYVVDDLTAILKDGKRINVGSNTISLGNNSSPRYATLSSMAQLNTEAVYPDAAGASKTVRVMPGDYISLTKSNDKSISMKFTVKYYSKEAPNLIDIVSPGITDGFVRFVDGGITQSGTAVNGVTPYTVSPELVFDQPGSYPVTLAIRDYTLGRTLATMQFNVSVVTDGTDINVSPNTSGVVGNTYSIRTFPAFINNSNLESKRVEILRRTDATSGGQTIVNRTLTGGQDDFDYVFDQDGEYIFRLYNKFKGASAETQVQKSVVVLPQEPQVDFDIREKAGSPMIFEVTDLSRYVDDGTVFVDASPYVNGFTQSDWQTTGTKRVKQLTFAKAGTYRVTVTGRNKYGETSTRSRDITVSTDVSYDIRLQDSQGNVFPQNQTPRFVVNQGFTTKVTGRNIAKVEVSYGNNQPLLTMSNGTTEADGSMTFSGNIQLAEQGQYSLTYTLYSVTKPTEKALTISRSILIRRPLEPLADFSVSQDGVVLAATPGLCTVGGASKEGYTVNKSKEYTFDGSASLASSDLPVNRDSATTSFRWNMGAQQLASRTVSVRERFAAQSADASACVPVTFTILENVNGQAKTSQLTKYFKVENSLPTYDSFVVEWPTGPLVTPMSVKAKLRGLRDPDEASQNIQVLWFYEIQGSQLFNEVSYDSERVIRIENYGAEGSTNTVRIGAQIYDMNTKESVKVYSDQRSIKTGTNPALRTSVVSPQVPQGISYIPWVKGAASLSVKLSSDMTDGSPVQNPQVTWSVQRYGNFEGCTSTPEGTATALNGTGLSSTTSFASCGLYRVSALVSANGQRSQQTVALKVYDNDTLLSAAERPVYLASAGLRSSSEVTAPYIDTKENTTSPFFPTGSGNRLSEVRATYLQALSPTVVRQAASNGYTGSGTSVKASYNSVYDMLSSYNLPANVIYDRLAQDDPAVAVQLQQLRSAGRSDAEVRSLLEKNLAGSAINYDPSKPYNVPFGVAYDVYAEFGLRPAAALDKVAKDDPTAAQRISQLRQSGSTDANIVQSLRNDANLTVQADLHAPAQVKSTDIVDLLVTQGLNSKEIVDKLVLDNPALETRRDDLLLSKTNGELLQKLQGDGTLTFQALAPIRMSLARAYMLMKERAYTDKLMLDKFRADDPTLATAIAELENRGVPQADMIRQLLTEPGREVTIRVAGAIQSDFATIFATLKHHGLATESIYEKMQQDDDVFRVVYEAAKKRSTDISGYYQEFAQEPTLEKLTYKPESMFVLPLRLAYEEYSALGMKPTQVFERIAKDNPNFGTDYETLKRQKAGGIEIFDSLVRNGATRKVRFSYMRPFELTADVLPAFFERQGIPQSLAIEKVVQDNPQLSDWYVRLAANNQAPDFGQLQKDFPTQAFSVALFTGWDTSAGKVGDALTELISPTFALNVLSTVDADMGRLVSALRGQKKTDAQIYMQLVATNADRKLRLYPYVGMTMPLRDATRQLSILYPVDSAVVGHIARFDDAFGDFYTLALRRLYTPAATLASVGDRSVYVPAFRPVMATPTETLQAIELYGLSLEQGLGLYKDAFPEIAELIEKYGSSLPKLVEEMRALYPDGQHLPMAYLTGKQGRDLIRTNLGLTSETPSVKDYFAWLLGWGISSDAGLAQLATSDAKIGAILADMADKPLDEQVKAIGDATSVHPQVYKRFTLSFVDAFRVYERRGLSTGLIYAYMGGQDPVFRSAYEQQRLSRVAQHALYDSFKNNAATATVVTNPLLPATLSTTYLSRALTTQGIPNSVVLKKLQADQPLLAQTEITSMDAALTAVAKDSYLHTVPTSLTRAVAMTSDEKQTLFKAYGMTESLASTLAATTGSGLTLPPQLVVDVSTYVQEAQDLGIGTQQVVEDVIRLVPEKGTELRALLAQKPDGAQLTASLTTILTSNKTLPLFTKVQSSGSDDPVVAYAADVNGTVQELSGYIPGTLPLLGGSGSLLSESGDDVATQLLAGIRQTLRLPGGLTAYLYNTRLEGASEAFRYQNLEAMKAVNLAPDAETTDRLVGSLAGSGTLLRSAAPTENGSGNPVNIFGLVGETTLLDCQKFAVAITEAGEQTLVCASSTMYESGLETFRTVLLRLLGDTMPEEMTTLMTAFDRANSLEDRQEAMDRLRDRVTRLPVTETQRQELLRRLSFVKVFELDDELAQQLSKRGADQLQTRLENILNAAGGSMVTERGTLAQTFDEIQQQSEVGGVLLVRYSLALGDLLRAQSVDGDVKDMVLDTMNKLVTDFVQKTRADLTSIAGAAEPSVGSKLEKLQAMLDKPAYTFESASNIISVLRSLGDEPSMPDAGKTELNTRLAVLAKQLGAASAEDMREGIPAIAANRSDAEKRVQDLLIESSIWERQRRGLMQFTRVLAENTTFNAQEKQDILQQLYSARREYMGAVKNIIQTGDFSEASRADLTKKADAVLATTNLTAMLESEGTLWSTMETDTGIADSQKYIELWQKTAEYQIQFFRAASNVLPEVNRATVLPYFDAADLSVDRQQDILESLGGLTIPADRLETMRNAFKAAAGAGSATLQPIVNALQDQNPETLRVLRTQVLALQNLPEQEKVRFFAAYDRWVRQMLQAGSRTASRTGVDLLASLRDTVRDRMNPLVTSNPGLRPSAHVVHDLKKVVLAHPDLPLQYKLEMLFELQHAYPFSPFGTAFSTCTPVYVKDAADVVRRICLEEKNQQSEVMPVEKAQLFALMQAAAEKKPTVRSGALSSTLESIIRTLTNDQTLTLDTRRQNLSVLAQAFEWPDVSYADRNAALAYVYSLPVVSDEMLQLQETKLSLETYYISLGELESRLRGIMLGINELPTTLKGTVREALMQVKKYYNTDPQRSNIMLSLAGNVIRGSDLQPARKDMLVRVLDTLGDTMQPVPVERLTPEASLEQLDILLASLVSVPDAQNLIADREDVERLLGQDNVLGSIGALSRLEQNLGKTSALSLQEKTDMTFYTAVARDFLSYVQSQRPRVADAAVQEETQPTKVDPAPTQPEQPVQVQAESPSGFWTVLWVIVYVIAGLLLMVVCLGVILYVLFLSYKRSHPDIHVDFEEYILVLRGQLAMFFKRFSKEGEVDMSALGPKDEPLPEKPAEVETPPESAPAPAPTAPVAPVTPAPQPEAPVAPTPAPTPVAPAAPASAAPATPSWLQLGDEWQQPSSGSVNGGSASQDVQTPPDTLQSGDASTPQQ